MKRIIIMGAAAAVLAGAVAAYAASSDFNSYTAKLTFSPGGAGSKAKPSAFAMHEVWDASGNNGDVTAPLTKIVYKIYGVTTNGKDFPKCTDAMITNAGNTSGWNKVCPKGSLIAQGPVTSELVGAMAPAGPGTPCDPYLYIYNGGQGTQVFFFTEPPYAPGPQYTCAGGAVITGSAPPYDGHVTSAGGYSVVTIPLPPTVSTEAGGLTGTYASLVSLNVKYAKLTTKVKGKTVAYAASTACKAGKRPYAFTFYAQNYEGQTPATQTTTVPGSQKC